MTLTEQIGTVPTRPRVLGAVPVLLGLLVALAGLCLAHLTQGTSEVGPADLLGLVTGSADQQAADILTGSRIPRVAAGLAVGVCLGVAGALLQSVARNALASPDTLAVTAGATFAITLAAVLGIGLSLTGSTLVAMAGGLAAAALVLVLAGGAGTATTRLILAGSATAMALGSGSAALLILFQTETTGLFAWGNGSLNQLGLRAFGQAAPLILAAVGGALLLSRRLDLLSLGDDAASVLGVPIARTRAFAVLLAVLLSATSVTLAGPIGFVGLCAPAAVRLLARWVPAMHRHSALILGSGLLGAIVVVGADLAIRAVLGADRALFIPSGVTTTLLGAAVLVILARQSTDAGPTRQPPAARVGLHGRRRFLVALSASLALFGLTVVVGLLAGYTWLRTGDLAAWLEGVAHPLIRAALDDRAPRVAAAVVGGAGLALAGCLVQACCRNPLADPGILGISGGAGTGAVLMITTGATIAGLGTRASMIVAAVLGALIAFGLVYALAWRRGLDSDRLVLVGVGMSAFTLAISTFLLLRVNPFDTPRIFTWLSGTTYGRTWPEVLPAALALVVTVPLALWARRELDLVGLDEDTPRLAGVAVGRLRSVLLVCAAVLTALSVTAVGVVGFVGLVAPHAARGLVGVQHRRVLPIAMLLGATLLVLADTLGRAAIAPDEVPAGLVVALIGAPYFVYLLSRSRG